LKRALGAVKPAIFLRESCTTHSQHGVLQALKWLCQNPALSLLKGFYPMHSQLAPTASAGFPCRARIQMVYGLVNLVNILC
jgi:hypothetical protein